MLGHGMPWWLRVLRLLPWAIVAGLLPLQGALGRGGIVRVAFVQNSKEKTSGWDVAFRDFFVPHLRSVGGFSIHGDAASPYDLDVVSYEVDLSPGAGGASAVFAKIAAGLDDAGAPVGDVDVVVVGSSQSNADVMAKAEALRIPNLHCSGGDPTMWTASTPHAFGIHLPFPWYSRGPLRQAKFLGMKTAVILRDFDWGFPRISAAAAREWAREVGLQVIGPTVDWCRRYAGKTSTCREVEGACRCGLQGEYDLQGYQTKADYDTSFYEVNVAMVAEAGFDQQGSKVSPALVRFVLGIIEDVRSQGGDPDVLVNSMGAARSGYVAAREARFAFKSYFGGPNFPGTGWNGYDGFDQYGNQTVNFVDAVYNQGGGQWHENMKYTDPFFGTSGRMVNLYKQQLGVTAVDYNPAGCVAVGVVLSLTLHKYGTPLSSKSLPERRDIIRLAVGSINDETLWGLVRFNRFNQNNGRFPVSWQVLEDGAPDVVLPPEAAQIAFRFPSPSWDARFGCPAGTFATGPSDLAIPILCQPCESGTYRNVTSSVLKSSECSQCPTGRGTLPYSTGAIVCDTCPQGRQQDGNVDRGICYGCPVGSSRRADSPGQSCDLCVAGRFANTTGLSECHECPSRTVQRDRGQAFCICDVGGFKDPKDPSVAGSIQACLSCDDVLAGSHSNRGAISSDECSCKESSFLSRDHGCVPCSVGLTCPGGTDAPQQQDGFYATLQWFDGNSTGLSGWSLREGVVRCRDHLQCRAGAAGQCPAGRYLLACAECLPGYRSGGGECVPCSDFDWLLPVSLGLLTAGLSGAALIKMEFDMAKTSIVSLTILVTASQLVMSIQTLSAVRQCKVGWSGEFKTLLDLTSIFSFDYRMIRIGCAYTAESPLFLFCAKLLSFPALIVFLGFAALVGKWLFKRPVSKEKFINFNGTILSTIHISLTHFAISPFQCRRNPNGTSSMYENPSVVCWSGGVHASLIGMSVVAILVYPVFLFAVALYATRKYPVWVTSDHGLALFRCFGFLFGRFKKKCYYFGVLQMTRNDLIALIPTLLVEVVSLQIVTMSTVLLFSLILQVRVWPLRAAKANMSETMVSAFLLVVLVAAAPLVDASDSETNSGLGAFLLATVIFMFSLVLGLLGHAVYKRVRPSRMFDAFLCHHKAGAGAFARFMKLVIERDTYNSKVFLDSDNLEDLDSLFDVVRVGTATLVVILSPEVLTRMWCAGEVVTASRNLVKILPLFCGNTQLPTDNEVLGFISLWTEDQVLILNSYNIDVTAIQDAYRGLRALERLSINRLKHLPDQENAIHKVMAACNLSRRGHDSNEHAQAEAGDNKILILGSTSTAETLAVCHVIQSLIMRELREAAVVIMEGDKVPHAHHMVVVLSKGLLIEHLFPNVLLEVLGFAGTGTTPGQSLSASNASRHNFIGRLSASSPRSPTTSTQFRQYVYFALVNADSSFEFPAPEFVARVEREGLPEAGIFPDDGPTLAIVYRTLMRALAIPLNALGSEQSLQRESSVVCTRLMNNVSRLKTAWGYVVDITSSGAAAVPTTSSGATPVPTWASSFSGTDQAIAVLSGHSALESTQDPQGTLDEHSEPCDLDGPESEWKDI
mmetsp:Transcript_111438/g.354723  ORF Transcript_111438/g.354723 Transcript_111438/m.354723 type:complete len:1595 (-) Transcript_111438:541-5325(-)